MKLSDTGVAITVVTASVDVAQDSLERLRDRVTMIRHALIAASLICPWAPPARVGYLSWKEPAREAE